MHEQKIKGGRVSVIERDDRLSRLRIRIEGSEACLVDLRVRGWVGSTRRTIVVDGVAVQIRARGDVEGRSRLYGSPQAASKTIRQLQRSSGKDLDSRVG